MTLGNSDRQHFFSRKLLRGLAEQVVVEKRSPACTSPWQLGPGRSLSMLHADDCTWTFFWLLLALQLAGLVQFYTLYHLVSLVVKCASL